MQILASTACVLISFSILLPILPVITFYTIYYGLVDGLLLYFSVGPVSESARGLVSALSAVGVVNLIVCAFVCVAYREKPLTNDAIAEPGPAKKQD